MAQWGLLLLCACALFGLIGAQSANFRLVNFTQGPVVGYKVPNSEVFAFYSIPYATAPTGVDKFKAPLPPPKWTAPYEAVDKSIICPQIPVAGKNIREDCLITNIYVPDTQATNLPVMVSVHGGAFQRGFGDANKPVSLVNTKRLIVVNFNYRLGAHGYLCLGTEAVPGNAGMKDQVALLRWVQANIAAFGGNPNDVTINGCSAGGVSVDLLRISKTTDGLFNKALAGSGGNAGSFGIQLDPIENAKTYAKILNFGKVDDFAALEQFFKTASYEVLQSRLDQVMTRPNSNVLLAPCVEKDIGVERFLDDAPVNILKKGQYKRIPLLYGFAEMEGLMRLSSFNSWRHKMNEKFSDFLPGDLKFTNAKEQEEVARKVKTFYFGNQSVNEDTILTFIDYFSDVLFAYSMLRSVRINALHGNKSPVYLYEYSFVDENTPIIPHTNNVRGATHCNQLHAFADQDETNITQEYRNMKAVMGNLVLDFVTTGNPVTGGLGIPSWGWANASRDPHVNLDVNVTLRGPLLRERAEFWDQIYDKYYRTPMPPHNSSSIVKMISSLWVLYSLVILFIM